LLKISPSFSDSEILDFPSFAVHSRTIMDTFSSFYYLAIDTCPSDEMSFRHLVWEYHGSYERRLLLRLTGSTNPILPELEKALSDESQSISQHPFFNNIKTDKRNKIIKGETGIILTNSEISAKADIDPKYYKAQYKYLSSYIHSYSIAQSQLASFSNNLNDVINLYVATFHTATAYFSKFLLFFPKLFPEKDFTYDDYSKEIIDRWTYVMKYIISQKFSA